MAEVGVSNPDVHYLCQQCGNCCRYPGEVILEEGEVDSIAEYLELSPSQFAEEYTELRQNRQGLTLISDPQGACIFLTPENRCAIHSVKPKQCEGFPNAWNFPGWKEICEAIPVPIDHVPRS
ncbi:MAG: YkgJ family cysteine cluster protein [Verrucomicrobiota bacterium]